MDLSEMDLSEMRLRDPADEGLDAPSTDVEAPEADAAEQRVDVRSGAGATSPDALPLETDPADLAEQGRVVELDEDDYR
jgi:hypothetical protein